MAVSMACSQVIPTSQGTPVFGCKFTVTLSLVESGGTATALTSIQPFVTNGLGMGSTNVRIGSVTNSLTNAGLTGAAIAIGASSTNTFNYEVVIDGEAGGMQSAEPINNYQIGCTCQTSDGSVFSAPQISISIAERQASPVGVFTGESPAPNEALGTTKILGTSTNAYGNTIQQGTLHCDYGFNSGSLVAAGILL